MSDLARRQLTELSDISDGAIEVIQHERLEDGRARFTVSLDTSGISTSRQGIHVRGRERFNVYVDATFPATVPHVVADHTRWAGTPHVQWQSLLCLYAAPSVEWNPADGMRGLIARLVLWLQHAAAGDLDPDDQPLHPPITYSKAVHGSVVIRKDFGDPLDWATGEKDAHLTRYAWCRQLGDRLDVLEWLHLGELADKLFPEGEDLKPSDTADAFVAPVFVLGRNLPMEYPSKVATLVMHLERTAVSRVAVIKALALADVANRRLRESSELEDTAMSVMLLATPARRLLPGQPRAHLTAWHLDSLGSRITRLIGRVDVRDVELTAEVFEIADAWIDTSDLRWMVVHEARPEVTRRRDRGSPSEWLQGKRVLVLGCGALGAPIAEQCVRAGVHSLHLIDKGRVSPGVLVRQPFEDSDIGLSKSIALSKRLTRIRSDLTVTATHQDVVTGFLTSQSQVDEYDVVIDATADVGVRVTLERLRSSERATWPPVVTALFGHTARRGIVTVSATGATGAGHDVLRRVAIDASTNTARGWSAIAEDLFPATPRAALFSPEPGCSAPTFTGSATDVTALASRLFSEALAILDRGLARPMSARGVSLESLEKVPEPLHFANDIVQRDESGEFEVRLSRRALEEVRAEARRGARVRGARVETGGMLLGSLDDATQTVLIDAAVGPSPDSRLSAIYFSHGVEGTQEVVTQYRRLTHDRVGFIGMWHTHPYGPARPSETDELGMADIVAPDSSGGRAVMLILGGQGKHWTDWLWNGADPLIYARVVHRAIAAAEPGVPGILPRSLEWFPGGYAYPAKRPHRSDPTRKTP